MGGDIAVGLIEEANGFPILGRLSNVDPANIRMEGVSDMLGDIAYPGLFEMSRALLLYTNENRLASTET